MSVEPQPPIQRFLDVSDLVGNVFERLDPASRRAFFQSHPQVATAGPVLAQSELRVELNPVKSLEDQWQRVLRLTRSQPLRCLALAGHSREELLGFLRFIPQGRQEEKQKVLHGTELFFQVVVKVDIKGATSLQDYLNTWYREHHLRITEGVPVWPVLDLCGRKLITGTLEPPEHCTIRNGALQLRISSHVTVAAKDVRFIDLKITGVGERGAVVEVVEEGSLKMKSCLVEGEAILAFGGAVDLKSCSSSLSAKKCTFRGRGSSAVHIQAGARAVMHHCKVRDSKFGMRVRDRGSTLQASHCRVEGCECHNIWVHNAHACLDHVFSTGSKGGEGLCVHATGASGQFCSMVVIDSVVSGNAWHGVFASLGAILTLVRVHVHNNKWSGIVAGSGGTILAEDCSAKDNRDDDVWERDDGRITILNQFFLGGQHAENENTGMQSSSCCRLQ